MARPLNIGSGKAVAAPIIATSAVSKMGLKRTSPGFEQPVVAVKAALNSQWPIMMPIKVSGIGVRITREAADPARARCGLLFAADISCRTWSRKRPGRGRAARKTRPPSSVCVRRRRVPTLPHASCSGNLAAAERKHEQKAEDLMEATLGGQAGHDEDDKAERQFI